MTPTRTNGKICYLEIATTDVARSAAFYQAVFGWMSRRRGDGALAFDDAVGGVSGAWITDRPPSTTPGLLTYVMVDDALATSDLILASGGRIVLQADPHAREVTARFADPDGNVLGLYQQRAPSA